MPCSSAAAPSRVLTPGGKATKRTFEMICHYMSGLASEDELAAYFAKLKARDDTKRLNEQEQLEGAT